MVQLSNIYTGGVLQIPNYLTVNHLYYAYDTKELYGFNIDGSPILIVSNDQNIQISDVFGLSEYLQTNDIAISGLTSDVIDIYNLITSFSGDTQNKLLRKQNLPTGFITGLQLSINPIDNTKFDIASGAYTITNFSDITNVSVDIIQILSPITGITPTYLNTNIASYIALDENQNVIQSSSPFDNDERRTLALIGAVIHSNLSTINTTNEIKAPIIAPTNQLHDLIKAIGPLNLIGNIFSANGANLSIDKSAGQIWGMGINPHDYTDPHRLTLSGQTALTFRYRLRTGVEGSNETVINPNSYDLSGVLTSVPNNKFTVQHINIFQSGLVRIQYGQIIYNNMPDAKTFLATDPFVIEQNIADNSIFRAYLIVKQGITNLSTAIVANDAAFIPVDKFGSVVGSAGVSLTLASIVAALGYTPEDVSNKVTTLVGANNTTYPTSLTVSTELSAITASISATTSGFTVGYMRFVSPAFTPLSGTTYYFAEGATGLFGTASTSNLSRRISAMTTGRFKKAHVASSVGLGAGPPSNVTVHLDNITQGTSVQLTSSLSVAGNIQSVNVDIDLAVTRGDLMTLRLVTPAWPSNPTNFNLYCDLTIEK